MTPRELIRKWRTLAQDTEVCQGTIRSALYSECADELGGALNQQTFFKRFGEANIITKLGILVEEWKGDGGSMTPLMVRCIGQLEEILDEAPRELKKPTSNTPDITETLENYGKIAQIKDGKIDAEGAKFIKERICVECGYCQTETHNDQPGVTYSHEPTCRRHRDLITGILLPCDEARALSGKGGRLLYATDQTDCGPEGKFWKPKEKNYVFRRLKPPFAAPTNRRKAERRDPLNPCPIPCHRRQGFDRRKQVERRCGLRRFVSQYMFPEPKKKRRLKDRRGILKGVAA